MKFFIKSLDEVEENLRGLYKPCEGGFSLDVDVKEHPEFQAVLKNKNDILEEKRIEAEKRRAAEAILDEENRKKSEANAKTREDFEKVLADERAHHAKQIEEMTAAQTEAKERLNKNILGGALDKLASALSGDDAELIKPHLASRLTTVEVDGELRIMVNGKDGKPSGLTVEQLEADIRNDKMFAALVKGRGSSGSGLQSSGNGHGNDSAKYFDPKSAEFSLQKQTEIQQKNPTLYSEMSAKFDPLASLMPGM